MSNTPETQEAVERWQQGKINIFDEMARLERERDEARIQVKLLRVENNHNWQANDLAEQAFRERDEAREALRVLFKDYKELADSGDAGFWDLEDKDAAQPALKILRNMEALK